MNSAFHSSGTASGNVEMMNRWKPIMTTTATAVMVGLCERSRTSGTAISRNVPPLWATPTARSDAQVAREVAVKGALDRLDEHPRRVGDHLRDHVREVAAELRERGAGPDDDDQQLRGHDHVDSRVEGEKDQRRQGLPRAGGG